MKKIIATMMVVCMSLSLMACANNATTAESAALAATETEAAKEATAEPAKEQAATEPATTAEKHLIGLAMHNQTADWAVQMKDSFLEEASKHDDVDVTWNDANATANVQVSNIEDLIAQGCEVIVVDPADYAALGQALKECEDAGVKVVNCDSRVAEEDQDKISCFITANNYNGGKTLGEYLVDMIPQGGTIGYLNYPQISAIQDRFDGINDVLKAAGRDDVTVVDKECTDLNAISTYTEDMLMANPEVSFIICLNDNTALTAWAACDQLGKGDIKVYGFDGSPAGKQSIANGQMSGSMVYSPVDLAVASFNAAYAIATGNEPNTEVDVPMWLISPENIAERDLNKWE